jgi:hypothetical protein
MSTRTLPHRLQLQRPLADRWLDAVQHALAHWLERRTERREADLAVAVERELQRLDARTLCDIGAPQGLLGQRRWHDEQEHWSRERLLRTHGW